MRSAIGLLLAFLLAVAAFAQAPTESKLGKRYGIEPNVQSFHQATPKETLESVMKAIEQNKIAYLLAQLSDPEFVDERVQKIHAGKFDDFVEETRTKLADDPGAVKKLRRFLDEGNWEVQEATASAQIKGVPERVFFRKIEGRWFFQNKEREKEKGQKDGM